MLPTKAPVEWQELPVTPLNLGHPFSLQIPYSSSATPTALTMPWAAPHAICDPPASIPIDPTPVHRTYDLKTNEIVTLDNAGIDVKIPVANMEPTINPSRNPIRRGSANMVGERGSRILSQKKSLSRSISIKACTIQPRRRSRSMVLCPYDRNPETRKVLKQKYHMTFYTWRSAEPIASPPPPREEDKIPVGTVFVHHYNGGIATWIFTSHGVWIKADEGYRHKIGKKIYRLSINRNGIPSWILKSSFRKPKAKSMDNMSESASGSAISSTMTSELSYI